MGDLAALRAELDCLAVSYQRAGAQTHAALHDMGGGIVWLMGPQRSGLRWQGPLDEALELLRRLPDDPGPGEFWRAFDVDVD